DLEEERLAGPRDRGDGREGPLAGRVVPDLVRLTGDGVAHHHLQARAVLEERREEARPVGAAATAALIAEPPTTTTAPATPPAPAPTPATRRRAARARHRAATRGRRARRRSRRRRATTLRDHALLLAEGLSRPAEERDLLAVTREGRARVEVHVRRHVVHMA